MPGKYDFDKMASGASAHVKNKVSYDRMVKAFGVWRSKRDDFDWITYTVTVREEDPKGPGRRVWVLRPSQRRHILASGINPPI